jgi:hypothetical protein
MALRRLAGPTMGQKGNLLALALNQRYSGQREFNFLREMINLKKKIKVALKRTNKLETAIADVMAETGKSRSHVMKAWTFTVKKGIPLLAKYNPQQSPREAGES